MKLYEPLPEISHITRDEDGRYWFSITWEVENVVYNPNTQTESLKKEKITTKYCTGKDGRGLWLPHYPAWKQILGDAQFSLNRANRRDRVKLFAIEDSSDFEKFCDLNGFSKSLRAARVFFTVKTAKT